MVRTPPPGNRLVRTEGVSSTANGAYDYVPVNTIQCYTDMPCTLTMGEGGSFKQAPVHKNILLLSGHWKSLYHESPAAATDG